MGIHFRPRHETQLQSVRISPKRPSVTRHFRYILAHFSESQPFTMSANFVGKYQRTSAEKYEEFLAALGVNYLLRKAATVSTPVMEVSEEGGNWTIKTSTTLKLKLDEEFEETTPDGREVKSVVKMEGNKLVTV